MTYASIRTAQAAVSLFSILLIVGSFLPTQAQASVLGDFIAALAKPAYAQTVDSSSSSAQNPSGGNTQTMDILAPATNLDPSPDAASSSVEVVGSSALVPQEGPSGSLADIQKTKNGGISVYVVRPGDTLSEIADLYGVPLSTILWANDLTKSSSISPGDKLVILPVPGVIYTVRKGDTLASIAKRYGGDPADIASFNGVDDSLLASGDQIIIPDGELPSASIASSVSHTGTKTTTSRTTTSSTGTKKYGPEPAHNVGPAGSASQIAYYIAPLAHYLRTQGIHGYNAVDLAAPSGTPIRAAADGVVIVARQGGWNGGYGSYVVIQHDNGSETLYAHMSGVDAYEGEEVTQGETIGLVGMTGEATGPHVHFEIRNGIKNPF